MIGIGIEELWHIPSEGGLFEKGRKYILDIEGYGDVECVWDGEDFYPNENINAKYIQDLRISGIVIGCPLNGEFTINSVRQNKI